MTFNNSGTVNVQAGTLSVTSPGTNSRNISIAPGAAYAVSGNWTLVATSVIDSQVRGTGAGDRGLVTVSGTATLNGTLNISFVNGFDPAVATSFPVLTYGSRSGTFGSVTSSGLGAGKAVQPT